MDTGTITPLIKRLEAARFVTRTRDATDERRVLVDLTEKARGLQAAVRGITAKIKTACQLTDAAVNDLGLTLEALAHPPRNLTSIEGTNP